MATIPLGLCQCGCGQATKPAPQTRRGIQTGQLQRFVLGHTSRNKPRVSDAGVCACGCGAPLKLAKYPSQQSRWIHGHNPTKVAAAAVEARFWSFVQKSDGCWEWTGATRGAWGHSRFHVGGRRMLAHRYSWELASGPIPRGLFVLHRCDNGCCVRPDHLFLGTQRDNMHDMVRKGRHGNNRARRAA